MPSGFSQFDFFITKYPARQDGQQTHLLLAGGDARAKTKGVLNIPFSEQDELFRALAADLKQEISYTVSEKRSPYFRYFMDFDFYVTTRLTKEQLEAFAAILYQSTRRFYTTHDVPNQYMCIITDANDNMLVKNPDDLKRLLANEAELSRATAATAATGPRPANAVAIQEALVSEWTHTENTVFVLDDGRYFANVHRYEGGYLKHGVHAFFPFLIVDSKQALFMREALCEALFMATSALASVVRVLRESKSGGGNPWDEVVDNAVYTSSGMRMYGAVKAIQCPSCKNAKASKADCLSCGGRGKINGVQRHSLHSVYTNGKRDEAIERSLVADPIRIIQKTSIRRPNTHGDPTWERFPGCPSFGDSVSGLGDGVREAKAHGKSRVFKEDARTTGIWKRKEDAGERERVTDPAILEAILRTIRTRFGPAYANLRFAVSGPGRHPKVCRDKERYYVNVDGEGCQRCLNLHPARDHTSNTIWFQFDKDGTCCMKCFSKSTRTDDRRNGTLCSKFKSPRHTLDSVDKQLLFGHLAQENAKKDAKRAKR
jgi:hypothetical protein